MKITQEPAGERQIVLNIEVEPSELDQHLESASRKLAQRLAVPGFRPGKAPRWMVERLVGKDGLLDEAIETLVPKVTQQALEQESVEWSAPPSVEVAQKEPLVLKATVPLTPTIELGDYHSLAVEEDPVLVDEEQVQKSLESLRREQAPWEPVSRAVEPNDLVVLSLTGTVEGEPFFQQEGMPYIVSEDSSVPLPGFAKALVGTPPHQEAQFDLAIPGDYPESKVAGKVCHLTVKVGEVKAQRLPELDDEFAKGVGQGFESLEKLREHLRKNIRAAEEEQVRRAYEEKVVAAVLGQAKVEVPQLLLKHQTDHLLQDQVETLARQGTSLEDYLQRTGQTLEQLREGLEEHAREELLHSLVLRKIADAENIQVDEQAVAEQMARLARDVESQSAGRRRLRDDQQARELLGSVQRSRKALDRLLAIARGKAAESSQGKDATEPDPGKGAGQGP